MTNTEFDVVVHSIHDAEKALEESYRQERNMFRVVMAGLVMMVIVFI